VLTLPGWFLPDDFSPGDFSLDDFSLDDFPDFLPEDFFLRLSDFLFRFFPRSSHGHETEAKIIKADARSLFTIETFSPVKKA
jgi:hypothetical protein